MRTTITLDDDLFRELRELAHRTDRSFKQVVNETLRAGLTSKEPRAQQAPFRQETFAMGEPAPGVDLVKALQLASSLEDEELARKLELGK